MIFIYHFSFKVYHSTLLFGNKYIIISYLQYKHIILKSFLAGSLTMVIRRSPLLYSTRSTAPSTKETKQNQLFSEKPYGKNRANIEQVNQIVVILKMIMMNDEPV